MALTLEQLGHGIDAISHESPEDLFFAAIQTNQGGQELRVIWVHSDGMDTLCLTPQGRHIRHETGITSWRDVAVGRQDFRILTSRPSWAVIETVRNDGRRWNILCTTEEDNAWLRHSMDTYLALHSGVVDAQFHTIGAFHVDPLHDRFTT